MTYYPTTPDDPEWAPTGDVTHDFGLPGSLPAGANYFLAGLERCPDTGRLHFQTYVEWKNGKTISAAQAALGWPGVHVEPCGGDSASNQRYCKKDGDYVEYGEPAAQGHRTDLDEVRVALDTGVSFRTLSETHFSDFVRYERGFRSYRKLHTPKRDWPMEIIVLVGPSGTGKTRQAATDYPDAYWKPDGKWWDGYDGEETVVVDEMYGHRFPYSNLLRLLDRYPFTVEVKGGTIEFTSRRIVFTSNQEPEHWYSNEATHQMSWADSPLKRRLDQYGRIIRTGEVHRNVVGANGVSALLNLNESE